MGHTRRICYLLSASSALWSWRIASSTDLIASTLCPLKSLAALASCCAVWPGRFISEHLFSRCRRREGSGLAILIHRGFLPQRPFTQEAGNQRRVHGMSSSVCNHIAQDLFAQQRQIANQIQNLVADELVVKAERGIFQAILRQHHAIL